MPYYHILRACSSDLGMSLRQQNGIISVRLTSGPDFDKIICNPCFCGCRSASCGPTASALFRIRKALPAAAYDLRVASILAKVQAMARTIIHVDMDAFYASIEQRDNPSFMGKPVIVGGVGGKRGVVSAASYESRRYGVHSAMPLTQARRLCPDGIFLPVDMMKYRGVSEQLRAILSSYTPYVEPISLDEAYLDVTASIRLMGSAEKMGREMKKLATLCVPLRGIPLRDTLLRLALLVGVGRFLRSLFFRDAVAQRRCCHLLRLLHLRRDGHAGP